MTNVTNFGAFVDIGVHQDGLVHISAMSTTFVKDPRAVVPESIMPPYAFLADRDLDISHIGDHLTALDLQPDLPISERPFVQVRLAREGLLDLSAPGAAQSRSRESAGDGER